MRARTWTIALTLGAAALAVVLLARPAGRGSPTDSGTRPGDASPRGEAPPSLAPAPAPAPQVPKPDPAAPTTASGAGGLAVVGHVRAQDGAGVADAAVAVSVWRSDALFETAEGKAGADGAYRVVLPRASALDARARGTLRTVDVSVVAPRRLRADVRKDLPTPLGNEIVVDVQVEDETGPWLFGVVLLPDHRPAAGAQVEACGGIPPRPPSWATTDERGRFRLLVAGSDPTAVETLAVLAFDVQGGVAGRTDVQAPRQVETDVGTLVLEPAGTIAGRVVLPDGTPAPGIGVQIVMIGSPEELRGTPCDGRGMTTAEMSSRPDGSFSAHHLRPGRYRVQRFDVGASKAEPDVTEASTGANDVVLVAHVRLVRLATVGVDGAPVRNVDIAYEELTADGDSGNSGAGNFDVGDGTSVIDLGAPTKLSVRANASGLEADPLEVEVPPDRWHVDAKIVLRPPRPKGRLAIVVTTKEGTPIPRFHAHARPMDVPMGSIFGGSDWSSVQGPLSRPLRPAAYEVDVLPDVEDDVGPTAGGERWAAERVRADVSPGADTTVSVTAVPAGWMRLQVVPPEGQKVGPGMAQVAMEGRAPLFGLWDDPAQRGRWDGIRSGEPHAFGRPLAPGTYVVTYRGQGFRPASASFDVRARETTDVRLTLVPK
jgi:hypothetical protein